jgi:hypothetical protein
MNLLYGQVILAKMYPVGIGGNCDVDAVIDYAKDAGCLAYLHKFARNSKKLVVFEVFCTQLNTIRTACDTFMSQKDNIHGQRACDKNIQPDPLELLGRLAEEVDIFFKGICSIPQILNLPGGRGIKSLNRFGKRTQCLGKAFGCRGKTIFKAAAPQLVINSSADTDIACGISACDEPAGIESAYAGAKFVTKPLCTFGE